MSEGPLYAGIAVMGRLYRGGHKSGRGGGLTPEPQNILSTAVQQRYLVYRSTSLIRNRHSPEDPTRALSIGLL